MPSESHYILLVEDDPSFAKLVRARLSKALDAARLAWVHCLADARSHCAEHNVDLLLLDLNLPDSEGIDTVRQMCQSNPNIPIIVLTGTEGDDLAIEALNVGAQDYVRKDEVNASSLGRCIRYAIERKGLEQLKHERHELQDAVRALEHVIAVIGHELRTPVAGMRGILEHLLDGNPHQEDESAHFLQFMHEEVVRLAGTLNNMLEAARLDSGTARWNWGEVELAPVIESAIETVQPGHNKNSLPIQVSVQPVDLKLLADEDAVRRLIVNLLTNALKHTSEGYIEARAAPFLRSGKAWVRIEIQDTGSGISPETAKRLGTAFALNSGIVGANHTSGTGLGMAICKGIAAAHGGSVAVATSSATGTTVTVELRADLTRAVQPSSDTRILMESARRT